MMTLSSAADISVIISNPHTHKYIHRFRTLSYRGIFILAWKAPISPQTHDSELSQSAVCGSSEDVNRLKSSCQSREEDKHVSSGLPHAKPL